MLGCDVVVLESRDSFTRLQVLHLWDWVECDLIDLGIKHIDASIFTAADFKHVGTAQLQHSLLKVALLLGVRVHFKCEVKDLRSLSSYLTTTNSGGGGGGGGGNGALAHAPVASGQRAPLAPAPPQQRPSSPTGRRKMNKRDAASLSIAEAATPSASNAPQNGGGGGGGGGLLPDVLLDATGARCELFEHLGFSHGVVLKSARALCIVMHLKNERSSEEMKLRESTWSANIIRRI